MSGPESDVGFDFVAPSDVEHGSEQTRPSDLCVDEESNLANTSSCRAALSDVLEPHLEVARRECSSSLLDAVGLVAPVSIDVSPDLPDSHVSAVVVSKDDGRRAAYVWDYLTNWSQFENTRSLFEQALLRATRRRLRLKAAEVQFLLRLFPESLSADANGPVRRPSADRLKASAVGVQQDGLRLSTSTASMCSIMSEDEPSTPLSVRTGEDVFRNPSEDDLQEMASQDAPFSGSYFNWGWLGRSSGDPSKLGAESAASSSALSEEKAATKVFASPPRTPPPEDDQASAGCMQVREAQPRSTEQTPENHRGERKASKQSSDSHGGSIQRTEEASASRTSWTWGLWLRYTDKEVDVSPEEQTPEASGDGVPRSASNPEHGAGEARLWWWSRSASEGFDSDHAPIEDAVRDSTDQHEHECRQDQVFADSMESLNSCDSATETDENSQHARWSYGSSWSWRASAHDSSSQLRASSAEQTPAQFSRSEKAGLLNGMSKGSRGQSHSGRWHWNRERSLPRKLLKDEDQQKVRSRSDGAIENPRSNSLTRPPKLVVSTSRASSTAPPAVASKSSLSSSASKQSSWVWSPVTWVRSNVGFANWLYNDANFLLDAMAPKPVERQLPLPEFELADLLQAFAKLADVGCIAAEIHWIFWIFLVALALVIASILFTIVDLWISFLVSYLGWLAYAFLSAAVAISWPVFIHYLVRTIMSGYRVKILHSRTVQLTDLPCAHSSYEAVEQFCQERSLLSAIDAIDVSASPSMAGLTPERQRAELIFRSVEDMKKAFTDKTLLPHMRIGGVWVRVRPKAGTSSGSVEWLLVLMEYLHESVPARFWPRAILSCLISMSLTRTFRDAVLQWAAWCRPKLHLVVHIIGLFFALMSLAFLFFYVGYHAYIDLAEAREDLRNEQRQDRRCEPPSPPPRPRIDADAPSSSDIGGKAADVAPARGRRGRSRGRTE